MSDLSSALRQLCNALMTDPDYYDSWIANIAISIFETPRSAYESDHEWRKGCARTFLCAITAGHEEHPFTGVDAPGSMLASVAHTVDIHAETRNQRPVCKWEEHPEDGYWQSACGEQWCFVDGGVTENRVRFCHGCGGKVEVV